MRKAMWLLMGLFGLFIVSPTAVPASDGCQFPFEKGKLVLNLACSGGGEVIVKASSSFPGACAAVSCPDTSIVVLVEGEFDSIGGLCTATATLDPEGDAHTKALCKNGANTKIEIIADSCVGSPCVY
jgi:hypothetical protein